MDRATRNAYLIAMAVIVLTGVALTRLGVLRVDTRPALVEALPTQFGAYRGVDFRYCQSDQCGRGFAVDTLEGTNVCPNCSGVLADASLAERVILPRDTTILRKQYRNEAGSVFTVAIALTGVSRQSIHPPQACLRAQGYSILSERVFAVTRAGADPLQVKNLDLVTATGGAPGGQYAYWFVARGRETPYHLQRLWWTAWDGVVHGEHRRWAYVAVTSDRPNAPGMRPDALLNFIAELYPQLQPEGRGRDGKWTGG